MRRELGMEHRFSGWPGAWCLDCGSPDLVEEGLADCKECVWEMGDKDGPCSAHTNEPCPRPLEHLFDPYHWAQFSPGD